MIKVETGDSLHWDSDKWGDAHNWAVSQFGRAKFIAADRAWYFGNENDAMLFRLKCL